MYKYMLKYIELKPKTNLFQLDDLIFIVLLKPKRIEVLSVFYISSQIVKNPVPVL